MTPRRQKREVEGTDEPLYRDTWTAFVTRPTRTAGASAEMKPCTQNATIKQQHRLLHCSSTISTL